MIRKSGLATLLLATVFLVTGCWNSGRSIVRVDEDGVHVTEEVTITQAHSDQTIWVCTAVRAPDNVAIARCALDKIRHACRTFDPAGFQTVAKCEEATEKTDSLVNDMIAAIGSVTGPWECLKYRKHIPASGQVSKDWYAQNIGSFGCPNAE